MSLLLALTGGTAPSDPFLVPDPLDEVLSQPGLDADASAYWQLDDDPAQPDTLSFDLSFNDDTETNPVELSAYAQVDDDAAQPDTALSWQDDPQDAFDELDGSSYQQLDDDLVAQPVDARVHSFNWAIVETPFT